VGSPAQAVGAEISILSRPQRLGGSAVVDWFMFSLVVYGTAGTNRACGAAVFEFDERLFATVR